MNKNKIDAGLNEGLSFDHKSGFDKTEKICDAAIKKIKKSKIHQTMQSCKICKCKTNVFFEKNGFFYLKCLQCNFIFIGNPLPDKTQNKIYIKSEIARTYFNYMAFSKRRFYEEQKYKYIHKNLFKKIGRAINQVVDIGCGNGFGLKYFQNAGFDVTGIEPNYQNAISLKKQKINVINSNLNKKVLSKYENTMFICLDVLEHINHLHNFLKILTDLKKKNNFLIVSVPNAGSLATALLGRNCTIFAGYSHLNYFNPLNIKLLFKSLNIKTIFLETYVSGVNLILKDLNIEEKIKSNKTFRNQFAESILNFNLGHKIFVVCKL